MPKWHSVCVTRYLSANQHEEGSEILQRVVASGIILADKLAAMVRCTNHPEEWFAVHASWAMCEMMLQMRFAGLGRATFRSVTMLRHFKRLCRFDIARKFIQITLARMGCHAECRLVADRFDRFNGHQQAAILRCLAILHGQRARRGLTRIAKTSAFSWARVTAATSLAFRHDPSATPILNDLRSIAADQRVELTRVLFALAWSGDRRGFEGIEAIVTEGDDEKVLMLLAKLSLEYGGKARRRRAYFDDLAARIGRIIETQTGWATVGAALKEQLLISVAKRPRHQNLWVNFGSGNFPS